MFFRILIHFVLCSLMCNYGVTLAVLFLYPVTTKDTCIYYLHIIIVFKLLLFHVSWSLKFKKKINELHHVANEPDVESRQRLGSVATAALVVPNIVHSTMIGDRSFPVAATRVWNSLPQLVTSLPSLTVFRWRIQTDLFTWSYDLKDDLL